jgi:hypothetical protein
MTQFPSGPILVLDIVFDTGLAPGLIVTNIGGCPGPKHLGTVS